MKKRKEYIRIDARWVKAILVITIILSSALVVMASIKSGLVNELAEDDPIVNDSFVIRLKQSDIDWMNKNYEVYETEFAVCMDYNTNNDLGQYFNIMKTREYNASEGEVLVSCSKYSELMIHSHPNGVCGLSDQDKEILVNSTHYEFMGVICGEDEFTFMNKELDYVRHEVIDDS